MNVFVHLAFGLVWSQHTRIQGCKQILCEFGRKTTTGKGRALPFFIIIFHIIVGTGRRSHWSRWSRGICSQFFSVANSINHAILWCNPLYCLCCFISVHFPAFLQSHISIMFAVSMSWEAFQSYYLLSDLQPTTRFCMLRTGIRSRTAFGIVSLSMRKVSAFTWQVRHWSYSHITCVIRTAKTSRSYLPFLLHIDSRTSVVTRFSWFVLGSCSFLLVLVGAGSLEPYPLLNKLVKGFPNSAVTRNQSFSVN